MKYLLIFIIAISIFSCNNEDKKVKIIEEQDSITKILEEKDSLIVIKKDSSITKIDTIE